MRAILREWTPNTVLKLLSDLSSSSFLMCNISEDGCSTQTYCICPDNTTDCGCPPTDECKQGAAPGCLLRRGGKIANMSRYCCASHNSFFFFGGGGGAQTHFFPRLQFFFHTHFVMGYGYYRGHDRLRWQAKKTKTNENQRGGCPPGAATECKINRNIW